MIDPKVIFGSFFSNAKSIRLPKEQILIASDETPKGVFFLRSGYIKTYDISIEGAYQVFDIIGPNEIFPLHWALDGALLPLYFESMCPVEVCVIPRPEFQASVYENTSLLRASLTAVLEAFRLAQERVKNLELLTARQRVAYHLLFLGSHYGHKKGTAIDIAVPITYKDLAESLSVTRETINRIMRQFITAELVQRSDHHIVICKPNGLKNILANDVSLDI